MYSTEPASCDPGRCRDEVEHDEPVTCAKCGTTPIYIVSVACLGVFCSRRCADLYSQTHDAASCRKERTA